MSPLQSGIEEWLVHHGMTIENSLVMDASNAAFPIPVTRNVGGFQLQEMRMLDYPYFADIRQGLNSDNLITSELPQLTMAWASPISLDETPAKIRFTPLISSSDRAWTSSSLDIMPKVNQQGETSYISEGETKTHLMGVLAQGRFSSFFADKESPLLENPELNNEQTTDDKANANNTEEKSTQLGISSVIKHAPENARIILFSSNDFLQDQVLQFTAGVSQSDAINSLQLMVNSVDWSLEDRALMSIRSRGNFNRTLPPMAHDEQLFWEYGNYVLALTMLVGIALWDRQRRRRKQRQYITWYTQS